MSEERSLSVRDDVEPNTLEPVVREAVLLVGVVGLVILGLWLPGTARVVPGTGIPLSALVAAGGAVVIAATLLYAAPTVESVVHGVLVGPERVVSDAASIAEWLVVFAAVLVAHAGLGPLLAALLDRPWAIDLAFLLVTLGPLAVIARRFARSIDPLARIATDWLVGESNPASSGDGAD